MAQRPFARLNGISEGSLGNWVKLHGQDGPKALEPEARSQEGIGRGVVGVASLAKKQRLAWTSPPETTMPDLPGRADRRSLPFCSFLPDRMGPSSRDRSRIAGSSAGDSRAAGDTCQAIMATNLVPSLMRAVVVGGVVRP
jgi:hypothetical protein